MFLHHDKKFFIYFGDSHDSVSLQEIAEKQATQAFDNIAQQLEIDQLVFLQQNHGIDGLHVAKNDTTNSFFATPGDYLVTQRTECAIGVVTADCLPIVIYDPISHTAAIVHAGWKGLLADIFTVCITNMTQTTGARAENLLIFLGPAARPCCYEVQQDFIDRLTNRDALVIKKSSTYFDSRAFIVNIATNLGIKLANLYTRYNVCTICNLSFCSYRREKEKARRQISMICLR